MKVGGQMLLMYIQSGQYLTTWNRLGFLSAVRYLEGNRRSGWSVPGSPGSDSLPRALWTHQDTWSIQWTKAVSAGTAYSIMYIIISCLADVSPSKELMHGLGIFFMDADATFELGVKTILSSYSISPQDEIVTLCWWLWGSLIAVRAHTYCGAASVGDGVLECWVGGQRHGLLATTVVWPSGRDRCVFG